MFSKIWPHLTYFFADFWGYLLLCAVSFILFIFAFYKIYKTNYSERKKKILTAIIFSLLLVIIVFSLFEAYFRFRYDESDGLGFLQVSQRWNQRHVVYNGSFFRDRDFTDKKKPGVIRIGVLGDSLTFGAGIKDVNNRFSNILEKELKDSGYNVEVYNLGKPGYDIDNEIDVYKSVKYLNFDIVVWAYFTNDIQPRNSTGTPIIVKNSQRAKILEFISSKSFFLDYLYWRFSSVYNKTIYALKNADIDQYKNPKRLPVFEQQVTDFISSLKKDNKKVVVIMLPSVALIGHDYPTFINDIMLKLFAKNDVPVVYLYPYLKDKNSQDLRASRFDTHPNEKVHKLTADLLYQQIVKVIKK